MMYNDSSSDDDSSSDSSDTDDDLDLLLIENIFPTSSQVNDMPRLKLEDLSETLCQQMFRYLR